jgi:hypothetical protein
VLVSKLRARSVTAENSTFGHATARECATDRALSSYTWHSRNAGDALRVEGLKHTVGAPLFQLAKLFEQPGNPRWARVHSHGPSATFPGARSRVFRLILGSIRAPVSCAFDVLHAAESMSEERRAEPTWTCLTHHRLPTMLVDNARQVVGIESSVWLERWVVERWSRCCTVQHRVAADTSARSSADGCCLWGRPGRIARSRGAWRLTSGGAFGRERPE